MIEKEIEADQVRVGQKIRVEYSHPQEGSRFPYSVKYEGVVMEVAAVVMYAIYSTAEGRRRK